ncbi:MAG TPA: hypothetical protein VER17_12910 [Tepidisphaeraceae bacterium]|nr:hypothetical protein [Tepidisphaeraceae bacterium]
MGANRLPASVQRLVLIGVCAIILITSFVLFLRSTASLKELTSTGSASNAPRTAEGVAPAPPAQRRAAPVAPAAGGAQRRAARPGTPEQDAPKTQEQIITHDLASDDPAVRQRAVAAIQQMVGVKPRVLRLNLRKHWFRPMIATKMYADLERLALEGILADPSDAVGCEEMHFCYFSALFESGQYARALPAGRSLYNVTRLRKTQDAIDVLNRALGRAAGLVDESVAQRFKEQQSAGALTPSDARTPTTLPAELGENVLNQFKIDPSPYEARIKAYQAAPTSFVNLIGRGNLLLLAGRPDEAQQAFEAAAKLATPRQLETAIEGVARSMRAQDGTVGRANAYILSLRDGQ